jgi:hypothetical protein
MVTHNFYAKKHSLHTDADLHHIIKNASMLYKLVVNVDTIMWHQASNCRQRVLGCMNNTTSQSDR